MDVICPACAARYVANDEKLRGKTARMRCKACNTRWMVSGPALDPAPKAVAVAKVTKTGKDREKRDLFAPRDVTTTAQKETLLPPPSSFGARNENSVLFSLDQLAQSSRAPSPPPVSRTAVLAPPDDEGIIDLKALSSVPPPAARPPVAPLFSEPAPMAIDIRASRPPTAGSFSQAQLFAGLAAAAAMLVVAMVAVFLSFRGEEPVKHMSAAVSLRLPPVVVSPPQVEPPHAATTAEPARAEEPKVAAKGRGGKLRVGKGTPTATTKTAAPAPKPVKAADPCHCRGNLNCILACTVKRGK